ncbi:MAG: hypothetical protein IKA62_06995 [Clostridia bacterium]|nr:hypothetical protein [Clostridia bacterium]
MRKNTLSIISLILIFVMVVGVLASCGGEAVQTTEAITDAPTEAPNDESSEKNDNESSEGNTEDTTEDTDTNEKFEDVQLTGPYADIIKNAHSLANGVQDYYSIGNIGAYYVENQNMSFEYGLDAIYDQQLLALKNTKGKTYLENTFDVFVKMTDGNVYYTSKTAEDATVNVFRYGYYYNEVRIEGQNLVNGTTIFAEADVPLEVDSFNDMKVKKSGGVINIAITDAADPYLAFAPCKYSTDEYKYIQVAIKNEVQGAKAFVYVIAGDETKYGAQKVEFSLFSDGEYHTYDIYLGDIEGYTGDLKGIRLDFDGVDKGNDLAISSVRLFDGEIYGVPALSVARIFHTYSDKLHHELQLVASENTKNIAEIGMITRIPISNVDKLIVKDASGTHDTLDGVDWNSAEYIGFDIKEAGIFGYILPVHETTGKMTVTLEGDNYVIVQSRIPENNTVLAGDDEKIGNTNDFYMGQRLYTDENHTFDAFITEATIERTPLTKKNFKVSNAYSDTDAQFIGYDAIRGSYEFSIPGSTFNTSYFQYPNKYFGVNFTVRGDNYNRNVYINAATISGSLECAVVLDDKLAMLPIPVEVAKNFDTDGDNTIYDIFDIAYGEAIFPIIAKSGESNEYNVLHLYQNWGNYPLKQISAIEYYMPYYHLSTGVTETNCLSILAGPEENLLPDHRGMSAPLWPTQPQHTSSGFHTIFYYTNEKGHKIYTNLTEKSIDSYGPIYADVTLNYLSEDGRILATYTHMEMPQTDENRGYYTIEYKFLEDVKVNSFKDSFKLYTVSDNDPKGEYQGFGYLNSNNQPTIANASTKGPVQYYVLGTEAPYFDYFNMKNCHGAGGPGGYYGNVSFIICDSEIIIGGEKVNPNFAVHEGNLRADLTLDLGAVQFKAGDKITINALITPWGSQESDYSGKNFAPDQNVRDMRENTALNPVKLSAGANATVIESAFLPKIKTTNGKSAEFTISGGENNIAIRAYGFTDLSAPKVYEKIDGEWVEYKLNSAGTPDVSGYHAYYDGYSVYYDGDGTYSYAFIVTMDGGAERTFKIETDDEFRGWPRIEIEEIIADKLPVYIDHIEVNAIATDPTVSWGKLFYQSSTISLDNGVQFTRLVPKFDNTNESYGTFYTMNENEPITSGQYFVIKYRTNAKENTYFEIYASTVNTVPAGGDNTSVFSAANGLYMADEQWHVVVLDLTKFCKTYLPEADGSYIAKYFRVDTTQGHNTFTNKDIYTDIAFIGLTDDLTEAIKVDNAVADVLFYDGKLTVYDPITGEPK